VQPKFQSPTPTLSTMSHDDGTKVMHQNKKAPKGDFRLKL